MIGMRTGRAHSSFIRKLYIAFLIETGKHNLITLAEFTKMHKRTVETALRGLPDIGIEYEFKQSGPRNRHGYYVITKGWELINRDWVQSNMDYIKSVLLSVTQTNNELSGV